MAPDLTSPSLSRRLGPGRALPLATAVLAAAGLLSGCGYGSKAAQDAPAAPAVGSGARLSADTVRIGYFDNLTHGTALVGLQEGFFQKELGGTRIRTQVFNAGPAEIEALNAGSLDIGWIGPSPAVNGFVRSGGQSLRIISGSASGGVRLVVNPNRITSPDDLRGKRIATPQLGNTQDVALLNYLASKGYKEDPQSGAGDVEVVRTDTKVTPDAYRSGSIDGAWVPEPTASKLVSLGARELLNEKQLWPDGKFVITNVVVSRTFLKEHPDVVEAVLRGSVNTNAFITAQPDRARAAANARIRTDTGSALDEALLDPAWADLDFLDDPLAATLRTEADHAVTAGLLKKPDLTGIYDLTLLDTVLQAQGRPAVAGPTAG